MRKTSFFIFSAMVALVAYAQALPPQAANAAQPAPVFNTAQFTALVDAGAQQMALAVARLRIDKWKTDSQTKQQSQASADSISRNLTEALPGMTAAVRTNPADLVANFKLYRNLNALYEVMTSLAESAGAFGPKQDYDDIAQLTANLDAQRQSLAGYIEGLAGRLESAAVNPSSATPASGRKKIIIDDSRPIRKKTRKKK